MQHPSETQSDELTSVASDTVPRLGPEPLQLIIARPSDLSACPFWISHYRRGEVSPASILHCETLEKVFELLNTKGLSESEPLMLSDNTISNAVRQFYLFPELTQQEERADIRRLVIKTLEAMKPEKIGIYFGPNHLGNDVWVQLIEEIAVDASFLRTREMYFYTGEMGVNTLLNAALRVKSRLEGRRDIFVYH